MSANVTVIGNLAGDPELRFTKEGKAVATFTVLTSTSKKTDSGWESTDVTAWRVSAWDKLGENVAESLTKGSPVVVYGKASWKEWENKDGNKGGAMQIQAYNVAVDLKRDPVSINKGSGSNRSKEVDPWATPTPSEEFPF